MTRSVEFKGMEFAVADKVGLMPLLRFAHAAKSGVDSADMDGMAALYDMLAQCIADEPVLVRRDNGEPINSPADMDDPDEVKMLAGWGEFELHATRARADDEELLGLVQQVMTLLSERPTTRPSDSSDGLKSTGPTSAVDSSSRAVVQRLKHTGRPDLALAVVRSQKTG